MPWSPDGIRARYETIYDACDGWIAKGDLIARHGERTYHRNCGRARYDDDPGRYTSRRDYLNSQEW